MLRLSSNPFAACFWSLDHISLYECRRMACTFCVRLFTPSPPASGDAGGILTSGCDTLRIRLTVSGFSRGLDGGHFFGRTCGDTVSRNGGVFPVSPADAPREP